MTLTLRVVRVVILLLAAPLAAGAQQPGKPARLGILYGAAPAFRPETDASDRAIVAGLRDHGYVVGQHVVIEFRSALGGGADRFPALAAELIGLGVDVILTSPDERHRTAPLKGLWSHQKGGFYRDGRFATLSDVVEHYNRVQGLGLTGQDKSDLIQYLLSL